MLPEELESMLADAGFERFRGRQIFHWLHRKLARSIDEMKNLPIGLRTWLAENTELGGVKEAVSLRQSTDGSYKFLFLLDDGRKVESVLMVDPKRNYWTQCLSSQVGCAVDCKFCVTGFNGFFRHMRVDEIVDQVLFARRHLMEQQPGSNYRNLVYMGMGEPLLNPDAVIKSIRLVTHREGVDLSGRRVCVSTSGIVPGMIQLAEADTGATLAISLNAPSQAEREKIMPITKKYPLADVLEIARTRKYGKHKRITFEYVMLGGINDSLDDARTLTKLLRGIPCKVNLIPFNPSPILHFERPVREHIDEFKQILSDANYTVSVRWSKALDVDGACGQLAGPGQSRERNKASAAVAPAPAPEALQKALGDLDFFSTVSTDDEDDDEG